MYKSYVLYPIISVSLLACATPTLQSTTNGQEGISYFLPKRLHQVSITRNMEDASCEKTLTIADAGLFADTKYQYTLKPRDNIFRNQNTVINTNSNGLLVTSTSTTTGTADTTIINAARSIAAVAQSFSGSEEQEESSCPVINDIQHFDLSESDDRTSMKELLNNRGFDIKFDDDLIALSNNSMIDQGQTNKIGLVYRREKTYLNSISCNVIHADVCNIQAAIVNLPQGMPINNLVPYGDSFTNESDTVTFSNGMLTGWTSDRKSEAAEIAKLPLDVIEAILMTPASLLTLRTTNTTNENMLRTQENALTTTIAAEERNELIQEIRTNLLRLCIAQAGDDTTRLQACVDEGSSN